MNPHVQEIWLQLLIIVNSEALWSYARLARQTTSLDKLQTQAHALHKQHLCTRCDILMMRANLLQALATSLSRSVLIYLHLL
jgi:hypothetical protein